MKRILGLVGVVTLCVVYTRAEGYARSFQQFHGPVNGADKEVTWTDHHGRHHEDYVANPHYEFAYGVEDPNTGERHGQKEHRDGQKVTGEYTVKEPDGNIRRVRYHADEDGFHAQVLNSNGNGNGNGNGNDYSDEGN